MVGYGENGSVIGPQNLPTSSVASGVWSLGEVAEAQRDEIWPNPIGDWDIIGTQIADGSTATYDFTGISQSFRDLRLVISAARAAGASATYLYMDIGSGFDTTNGNYAQTTVSNNGAANGAMRVSASDVPWPSNYDFPRDATQSNSAIFDIFDYSTSSKHSNIMVVSSASVNNGSVYTTTGGVQHKVAGAIVGIRVTKSVTSSVYHWKQPTTFTLFGRGSAV